MIRQFPLPLPALAMVAIGWVPCVRGQPAAESTPGTSEQPIVLSTKYFWDSAGLSVEAMANSAVMAEFYRRHPEIRLRSWSALQLPGNMWQQADLLAFAGGVAADIQPLFFHQIQFYAQQGLVQPLNAFIGDDDNGNQILEDSEIRWKPWLDMRPEFRRACMVGTKIYGIPMGTFGNGLLFRMDLFERAGLDPFAPPRTIEEFWRACQKLTDPEKNRYALSEDDFGAFEPWLLAAGADLVVTDWLDAEGKVVATTSIEEDPAPFRSRGLTPRYRSGLRGEAVELGLSWIRRFAWGPWKRDPATGEPVDLTEEEAARDPAAIRGVLFRTAWSPNDTDRVERLRRGTVAMATVTIMPRAGDFNVPRAGLMAYPVLREGDAISAPLLPQVLAMNSAIKDEAKQRAAWEWISFRTGPESARIENEVFRDQGFGSGISVFELERTGMTDVLADLPAHWREAQQAIFSSRRILPYANGWLAFMLEIDVGVIRPILADPKFDFRQGIEAVSRRADERIFNLVPPEEKQTRQVWSAVAVGMTVLLLAWGFSVVVRDQLRQARESAARNLATRGASRRNLVIACLLLLPAIALVLLFQYYPVGRGSVMAFQDYRLVGGSEFAGLSQFSEALFSSRFFLAVVNTIVFVVLNLLIGFTAPILLAFLLTEIKRGTVLFRIIYFLPSVTVGLIVALLWMRLFEPSPEGTLNRFLEPLVAAWNAVAPAALDLEWPLRWLQDPRLAMLSTILPTVWASMGSGCLIYLAALKSVPEEMYEAADLDGAGVWQKFRNVALPIISPLILVNFIGAFIGTFQSMGNIFVMTGGGPNYATHVLALEIWQNAFLYLRFGVATAQAWMVAAALIGFVVVQIRILGQMDWRRAGT